MWQVIESSLLMSLQKIMDVFYVHGTRPDSRRMRRSSHMSISIIRSRYSDLRIDAGRDRVLSSISRAHPLKYPYNQVLPVSVEASYWKQKFLSQMTKLHEQYHLRSDHQLICMEAICVWVSWKTALAIFSGYGAGLHPVQRSNDHNISVSTPTTDQCPAMTNAKNQRRVCLLNCYGEKLLWIKIWKSFFLNFFFLINRYISPSWFHCTKDLN